MFVTGRSKSERFTLVELLVVIAIIAILASMLLPSLRKAKDTALMSDCQSKQKQMVMAMTIYTSEWDDNLAPINTGHWQTGTTCFEQMDVYIFGGAPGTDAGNEFYHCNAEYRGDAFLMSYGANCQLNSGNQPGGIWNDRIGDGTTMYAPARMPMPQYPDPAGTFMFMCYAYNACWGAPYGWSNGLNVRRPTWTSFGLGLLHRKATTWGYVDGHVGWMRWQQSVGQGGSATNPKGIWTAARGD